MVGLGKRLAQQIERDNNITLKDLRDILNSVEEAGVANNSPSQVNPGISNERAFKILDGALKKYESGELDFRDFGSLSIINILRTFGSFYTPTPEAK